MGMDVYAVRNQREPEARGRRDRERRAKVGSGGGCALTSIRIKMGEKIKY